MSEFKKLKEALDWLAHGKLILDIVLAVGGARVTKALLTTVFKVPLVWVSSAEWLVGSLILWLLLRFGGRLLPKDRSNQWQTVTTALTQTSEAFNVEQFMKTAYNSALQSDFEGSVFKWLAAAPRRGGRHFSYVSSPPG
jgi:hypothetical protein